MRMLNHRPVLVGYLCAVATASLVLQIVEMFR